MRLKKLTPFISVSIGLLLLLVVVVPIALAFAPGPVSPLTARPAEANPMTLSSQSAQTDTVAPLPLDKMVLIAGNRTFANVTATLTLAGGDYGQGQEFTVGTGQEVRFDLPPGPYTATWSSPGGNGWGRRFEAAAGAVVLTWIFPEEDLLFSEIQQGAATLVAAQQHDIGQLALPSAMTTTSPFIPPDGKALYVLSNRSREGLPSTLTIYGGKFGEEGQEIILNPFQVISLAVEPGDYRLLWTAPQSLENEAEQVSLERDGSATAGKVTIGWLIPEEGRAFAQRPGEPGQSFELIPLEGGN